MGPRQYKGKFPVPYEEGSANPILPIIAVLGFFLLFLATSFWFLFRTSTSESSSYPSSRGNAVSLPSQGQHSSPFTGRAGTTTSSSTHPTTSLTGQPRMSSPFAAKANQTFDQKQAVDIVSGWLKYKSNLFADPFDISRLDQFAAKNGKLYKDITKKGGTIDWLRQRSSYYRFRTAKIEKVISYESVSGTPQLTVEVIEDLDLVTASGTVDPNQSGKKQNTWIYRFKKDAQGRWRIDDFTKQ